MACSLTTGNTLKPCAATGGVKEVLLANFENVTAITIVSGMVTAITMTTGKQFFAYKQESEIASWTEEWASDVKTGNGSYTQTVNIETNNLTAAQKLELDIVNRSRTMAITKDNDGTYWLFGEWNGLSTSANSTTSGVAMGDMKGSKITLTGKHPTGAVGVTSSLITALLSPAA